MSGTPSRRAFPAALKPTTYDEWEAAPLADEETGGCPICGGRHYSVVHPIKRYAPGLYRCCGTEWPNADGFCYQEACGARFRGRPGVHYDEEFFAAMTVAEFVQRLAA